MLDWILNHPSEATALNAIALTCLTLVLIFITAHYARATWKTVHILRTDLRFRALDQPSIYINLDEKGCTLTVRACSTPVVLRAAVLRVKTKNGYRTITAITINRLWLAPHQSYSLKSKRGNSQDTESWSVEVLYCDAIGLSAYLDTQSSTSHGYATCVFVTNIVRERKLIERRNNKFLTPVIPKRNLQRFRRLLKLKA
jgi:hypothetical protein